MEYLSVVNLDKFQHYKHTNPTWIKLYTKILNNWEFRSLTDESKLLYICCLLIASMTDNCFPLDPKMINTWAGLDTKMFNIKQLLDKNFLIKINKLAPKTIEKVYNKSITETETETEREREGEKSPVEATGREEKSLAKSKAETAGEKENLKLTFPNLTASGFNPIAFFNKYQKTQTPAKTRAVLNLLEARARNNPLDKNLWGAGVAIITSQEWDDLEKINAETKSFEHGSALERVMS